MEQPHLGKRKRKKKALEESLEKITEEKAEAARDVAALNSEKEAVNSKMTSLQNQKYELGDKERQKRDAARYIQGQALGGL